MDTLFRLVSLHSSSNHHHQQQTQSSNSFNSSKTSTTSSRSSKQATNNKNNYYFLHHSSFPQEEEEDQEECFNHHHHQNYQNHLYMDEDFSSSSSNPNPNPNPNPSNINIQDFSNLNINDLLLECARSVAANDTPRVQHLMWMLNELSSPYGDTQQKIAYYFLQALFARLTSSGPRTLRTLSSASDRMVSFDSTRRVALKFQELSPWSSFGHVAANGMILESFLDSRASPAQQLHIIDFSNTFCTQWPTLLEALATRSTDDTPHLTITTVVSYPQRVMKEIAARMEKFARLMGVPFKFKVVHHSGDLSNLDLDCMNLGTDTLLAVNCVNALHAVPPAGGLRDAFLARIRRLQPRIVTVIEEEADLINTSGLDEEEMFLKGFRESLKFFSAYFDSLEESFPKTSNERLTLERAAGRAVVDLISCPVDDSTERRETAGNWARRMASLGFAATGFSDDVADDVRALLRRYREGWGMTTSAVDPGGMLLTWKEQPVVWASAWRM